MNKVNVVTALFCAMVIAVQCPTLVRMNRGKVLSGATWETKIVAETNQ